MPKYNAKSIIFVEIASHSN